MRTFKCVMIWGWGKQTLEVDARSAREARWIAADYFEAPFHRVYVVEVINH